MRFFSVTSAKDDSKMQSSPSKKRAKRALSATIVRAFLKDLIETFKIHPSSFIIHP